MMRLRSKITDLLNPLIGERGRPGKGDIITFTPERGDNPDYLLRRLKRDDPALAERVLRGDVSAAILRGFKLILSP